MRPHLQQGRLNTLDQWWLSEGVSFLFPTTVCVCACEPRQCSPAAPPPPPECVLLSAAQWYIFFLSRRSALIFETAGSFTTKDSNSTRNKENGLQQLEPWGTWFPLTWMRTGGRWLQVRKECLSLECWKLFLFKSDLLDRFLSQKWSKKRGSKHKAVMVLGLSQVLYMERKLS